MLETSQTDMEQGKKDSDITFYDRYLPNLKAGNYTINVETDLIDNTGEFIGSDDFGKIEQKIIVEFPQFYISSDDITEMYPHTNAEGRFGSDLPYIVFNKRSLPWQIGTSDVKMPWLALLVCAENELEVIAEQAMSVTKSTRRKLSEWMSESPQNTKLKKPKLKLTREEESLECDIIRLSMDNFKKLLPEKNEIKCFAHVRKIALPASDGSKKDSWFSSILACNLPKLDSEKTVKNIVHLVSLNGIINDDALTENYVELVSLLSWSFNCTPSLVDNFEKHLQNIREDGNDPLKNKTIKYQLAIPCSEELNREDNTDRLIAKYLYHGYVPLSHHNWQGEDNLSWYRGPLIPFATSSEEARNDPHHKTPHEIAYAAGRMMSLNDSQLLIALSEARINKLTENKLENHRNYMKSKLLNYTKPKLYADGEHNNLTEHFLNSIVTGVEKYLDTKISQIHFDEDSSTTISLSADNKMVTSKNTQLMRYSKADIEKKNKNITIAATPTSINDNKPQTADNLGTAINDIDFVIGVPKIENWIKQVLSLENIPFHYLIAQARLLPEERLRFFHIDETWLYQYLLGALGLESSIDLTNPKYKSLFSNMPKSGLLLRSNVVKNWPNVIVSTIDTNDNDDVVYKKVLAPGLLLCLFRNIPHKIFITEPTEHVCFENKFQLSERKILIPNNIDDSATLASTLLKKASQIEFSLPPELFDGKKLEIIPENSASPAKNQNVENYNTKKKADDKLKINVNAADVKNDNEMCVPIEIDAFVINKELLEKKNAVFSFQRWQFNYNALSSFISPEPPPFSTYDPAPKQGVYLHWLLPRGLKHGIKTDGSGTYNFPALPNRWLVVRTYHDEQNQVKQKTWVIESDRINNQDGSPFLDPDYPDNNSLGQVKLGRVISLNKNKYDERLNNPQDYLPSEKFLTAVSGDVSLCDYQPSNQNILSFYDELNGIESATLNYSVMGWYSDAIKKHDPFYLAVKNAYKDKAIDTEQFINVLKEDYFLELANISNTPKPDISLALEKFHSVWCGKVIDVNWNKIGPAPKMFMPTKVNISIGNSALDAYATLVKDIQDSLLFFKAFEHSYLPKIMSEVDIEEILKQKTQQTGFGKISDNLIWHMKLDDKSTEKVLSEDTLIELDIKLNMLNNLQACYSRAKRVLQAWQWDMYAVWWKQAKLSEQDIELLNSNYNFDFTNNYGEQVTILKQNIKKLEETLLDLKSDLLKPVVGIKIPEFNELFKLVSSELDKNLNLFSTIRSNHYNNLISNRYNNIDTAKNLSNLIDVVNDEMISLRNTFSNIIDTDTLRILTERLTSKNINEPKNDIEGLSNKLTRLIEHIDNIGTSLDNFANNNIKGAVERHFNNFIKKISPCFDNIILQRSLSEELIKPLEEVFFNLGTVYNYIEQDFAKNLSGYMKLQLKHLAIHFAEANNIKDTEDAKVKKEKDNILENAKQIAKKTCNELISGLNDWESHVKSVLVETERLKTIKNNLVSLQNIYNDKFFTLINEIDNNLKSTTTEPFWQPVEPVLLIDGMLPNDTKNQSKKNNLAFLSKQLNFEKVQQTAEFSNLPDWLPKYLTVSLKDDSLSELFVKKWQQPHKPIFLEWEVEYDKIDFNNWKFEDEQYFLRTLPNKDRFKQRISDRTILTPHANIVFEEQLKQLGNENTDEDSRVIALRPLLSQRLNGFYQQLLGHDNRLNATVTDKKIAGIVEDQVQSVPLLGPLISHNTEGAVPNYATFEFLAAGHIRFRKLRVIGSFGQSYDLITPETMFSSGITVSENLLPSIQCNSEKNMPVSDVIELSPRFIQGARLIGRWADNENVYSHLSSDANPVCGWILPSYLTRTLEIYSRNGDYLGQIAYIDGKGEWLPWIVSDDELIKNNELYQIVQRLVKNYVSFFTLIQNSLANKMLGDNINRTALSACIGQPLALVKSAWKLELAQPNCLDHSWKNFTNSCEVIKARDGDDPFKIPADLPDLLDKKFPVKLGHENLCKDGLIGYFKLEQKNSIEEQQQNQSYQDFYYVLKNTDRDASLIQSSTISSNKEQDKYLVSFNKITGSELAMSFTEPALKVIMLALPQHPVNAYTGLFPVTTIKLPSSFIEKQLEKFEVMFRMGPLIAPFKIDYTIELPLPDISGNWLWLERDKIGSTDVALPEKSTDYEITKFTLGDFTGKPQFEKKYEIIEGWLNFNGLFAQRKNDNKPSLLKENNVIEDLKTKLTQQRKLLLLGGSNFFKLATGKTKTNENLQKDRQIKVCPW